MTASEAIRGLVTPILPGWLVQFGRWTDALKTDRFCVIRPAGGAKAELVRRPEHTLVLIGQDGGDALETGAAAELVCQTLRDNAGGLVFLQPGEPVFMATNDGRPVFEIAVSAITT